MPTVKIVPYETSVTEGETAAFLLYVDPPVSYTVNASVATITSGGASGGDGDYDIFDEVVAIPPNGTALIEIDTYRAGSINEGSEALGIRVYEAGYDVGSTFVPVAIDGDGRKYVDIIDQPIEVDIRNDSVSEGGDLRFVLRASDPAPENIWVTYEIISGASNVPISYRTGQAFISVGQTEGVLEIPTMTDGNTDDEQIRVRITSISGGGAVIDDDTATGTIYDSTTVSEPAPLPQVYIDNAGMVQEGNYAYFNVRIEGEVTSTVSVTVATYIGTANQGGYDTDYDGIGDDTTPEQILTFTSYGPQSQLVRVWINTDEVVDDGETFALQVESATNATFTTGERGTATIVDMAPESEPNEQVAAEPSFDFPNMNMSTANSTVPIGGGDFWNLAERFAERSQELGVGFELVATAGQIDASVDAEITRNLYLQAVADPDNWLGGGVTNEGTLTIDSHWSNAVHHQQMFGAFQDLGALGNLVTTANDVRVATLDGRIEVEEGSDILANLGVGAASGYVGATAATVGLAMIGITPLGWGIVIVGAVGLVVAEVATNIADETGATEALSNLIEDAFNEVGSIGLPGPASAEGTGGYSESVQVVADFDPFDLNDVNDISVTNLIVEDTHIESGEQFDMSYLVTNAGNDSVDYSVTYYLSNDSVISSDDEELTGAESTVIGLGAGRSNTLNMAFAVGSDFAPGSYYLLAAVQNNTNPQDLVNLYVELEIATASPSNEDSSNSGGSNGTNPSTFDPNLATLTVADAVVHSNSSIFDYRFAGTMLDGDEILVGSEGRDDVVASSGGDVLLLGNGDQLTLYGVGLTEIQWSVDANTGRLASYHSDFGYDQYEGEFNAWSDISGWAPYAEILALAGELPGSIEPEPITTTFTDGDGIAPTESWHWFDERFGEGSEFQGNEVIHGGAGKNDYVGSAGDDVLHATGEIDQYTLYGVSLDDINVSTNSAGNLILTTASYGTDELIGEFTAWIDQDQTWLSYVDLAALASTTSIPNEGTIQIPTEEHYNIDTLFTDEDAQLSDSDHFDFRFSGPEYDGRETVLGTNQNDDIVASAGDDVIIGSGGYDQYTLYGVAVSDLDIVYDPEFVNLYLIHDQIGADVIASDVEAVWSDVDGWYSMDQIRAMATEDFVYL